MKAPTLEPIAGVRNGRTLDGGIVDVAFAGGRIASVGSASDAALGPGEWDAAGRVVMPAFADVHTHLDKAGSLRSDEEPQVAGEPRLTRAARVMNGMKLSGTVEDIAARARITALRMLRRGTTAVRTHVDVDPRIGLRGLDAVLAVRQELAPYLDIQVSVMPTERHWRFRGPVLDLVHEALDRPGVEVMGGVTCFEDPPEVIVEKCFELALDRGLLLDLHTDETDDPRHLALSRIAQRTIAEGLHGRVVAGHCSSLSLQSQAVAGACIDLVKEAGVTVVAMPITNLYLLGNDPHVPGVRGMTRVRHLLEQGAQVAAASDNMGDPFMPFGNGDLLLQALMVCLAGQLSTWAEQQKVLEGVTSVPRLAMFPGERTCLEEGARADLVVLDHSEPQTILADLPGRAAVVRGGALVSWPAVE